MEGPGEVIGYGSANPVSEENYYDTEAMTYEGRIRAAVRAKVFWSREEKRRWYESQTVEKEL